MSDIKHVGICPAPGCGRGIEADDVVERGGVLYHDGCEPPAAEEPSAAAEKLVEAPTVTEPVVEPVAESAVVKEMTADEKMARLLEIVGALTAEITVLKQRPAAVSVAAVRKPKSEKGAPRASVYYLVKGFPSEKRPPQCLRVYRAIAQAAPEDGRMTEMDVWNALMDGEFPSTKANARLGAWNHVQTPFYIFKYYRQDMIAAEYVQGPFDV